MAGRIRSVPVPGSFFILLVLFGQLFLHGLASPVASSPLGRNEQAPLEGSSYNNQTQMGFKLGEDDAETTLPSWFTSTLLARRLLALTNAGVVSTLFPAPLPPQFPYTHTPSELAGKPVSLKEYIADCDEYLFDDADERQRGNPIFLALHVATTFRNIQTSSNNVSLSIDWWDHLKEAEPVYPGLPSSPAGLPRVTLFGYVEPIEVTELKDNSPLKKCYLKAHPDAEVWLPGEEDSPHSSFWARLVVREAYWIGGFGDVARIGWLDMALWKKIVKDGNDGWGSVKLPGE